MEQFVGKTSVSLFLNE